MAGLLHNLKENVKAGLTAGLLAGLPFAEGTVPAILADTWNRADDNTGVGNAETGQLWVPQASCLWGIIGGHAYLVTPGATNNSELIADAGVPNGLVTCEFTTFDSNQPCRILFRFVNTTNKLRLDVDTAATNLWKIEDGSFTNLGTWEAGANGDVWGMRGSGDDIDIIRNGTILDSITNSFNNTATKFGIGTTDVAPAARFGPFSMTA